MASNTTFKTQKKRRRQGRTNYEKRLALLKSKQKRLVVRVSNNKVTAQVFDYQVKGDAIIVQATSTELKKHGWKGHCGNAPAAYLTGLLCARKAQNKGVKNAVLDIGLHAPVHGSNVFAALKGAVDAGLEVPHDKIVLPSEDRVSGKTIQAFRKIDLGFDAVKSKIMALK